MRLRSAGFRARSYSGLKSGLQFCGGGSLRFTVAPIWPYVFLFVLMMIVSVAIIGFFRGVRDFKTRRVLAIQSLVLWIGGIAVIVGLALTIDALFQVEGTWMMWILISWLGIGWMVCWNFAIEAFSAWWRERRR